jgi:hypothetical protein
MSDRIERLFCNHLFAAIITGLYLGATISAMLIGRG